MASQFGEGIQMKFGAKAADTVGVKRWELLVS